MALIMNTIYSGYTPSHCYPTMTVGELIEFLSQYDPDTKIYTGHECRDAYGEIRKSHFEEYYEEDKVEEEDENDE